MSPRGAFNSAILIGLAGAVGTFLLMLIAGWDQPAAITTATAVLCAIWWISAALPMAATGLVPLAIFPLAGVLDGKAVAASYGHPLILLFLGGSLLSKALEQSGAHRQLALRIVRICGGRTARRLVVGFMLASAWLSMWVSNTATVLMLVPMAVALLDRLQRSDLDAPLLLGIAYAASIGGLVTHIGSPPNLVFIGVYENLFGIEITLLDWMRWSLPVALPLFVLAVWWLTRGLGSLPLQITWEAEPWSVAQRRVLWVFGLTALAWMLRGHPWGGWQVWFNMPAANDAAVALLAVVILFMLPDGKRVQGRLLDWERALEVPWGVFILFAGGLALAAGFERTGLSAALGHALAQFTWLPLWWLLIIVCLFVTFLTEITSNTATSTVLLPILAATALAAKIDPLLLMVPAALSASCAFMLPVATPPNAIVLSSERVSVRAMAQAGVWLNFSGALIIASVLYLILVPA